MVIHLVAGLLVAAVGGAQTFATHGDERLEAVIAAALEHNPQVLQAFADYQAALHRVPQATALPDPKFSATQYARSIETRVGPQERMLTLTQDFPGFGKRASKGQVASKLAAVADELYRATRAEVVRQVKQAYFDLAYVDRALSLSREDEQLLSHFEDMARRRYAQGFGLQGDVVRLQAQITQAINFRLQLQLQRVDLEASLNALRYQPADAPVGEIRLSQRPSVRLDTESLAVLGRRMKPELKAAFLRLEGREKGIELARRHYRPDFSVGVTWGNVRARGIGTPDMPFPNDGKDVYGVTVGMTLPLSRGKYDAGVREASELLAAAKAAYRNAANGMDAAIRAISFRMETYERQVELFETALLPQAEQSLLSMETAYANGALGVISLLDIQRMLLDVRLGLARLETDYLKALADLERAIGAAVPEKDAS